MLGPAVRNILTYNQIPSAMAIPLGKIFHYILLLLLIRLSLAQTEQSCNLDFILKKCMLTT
jgi:hypothetical protein